jgi:DNA-binding NarL/FixJ family response regulator
MRVVLVGRASRRQDLRRRLPSGLDVMAEAPSLGAARRLGLSIDAYLVASGDDEPDLLPEPLTPRERDVLELVAEGLSNHGVASRLGVSDETVKFHLSAIFGKLGASNRTDAVRQAIRRGLIPV